MVNKIEPTCIVGSGKPVEWAELLPDGEHLIVASWGMQVWDLAGVEECHFETPKGVVIWRARCTPDGERIVSGHGDCTFRVWDRKSGDPIGMQQQDQIISRLTLSADGSLALGASANKNLTLFDTKTAEIRLHVTNKKSLCMGAALSPDGRIAAHAGTDGYLRLYDLEADQSIVATAGNGWVEDVAASTEGDLFATGGRSKTVVLWGADGTRKRSLSGMTKTIQCVALSPDGTRACASASRGNVLMWDTATGKEIARMPHEVSTNSVSFSPDSKRIAVATDEGVYLYDL